MIVGVLAIINCMIYCDKSMIYHSSINITNTPKTADYISSLKDEVVEENFIQVITDNGKVLKQHVIT